MTAEKSFGPILDKIVRSKREEVEQAKAATPLAEMDKQAQDAPPPRDFYAAATRPGAVRLIAEVKKASPSKGIIREDFDPVAIAESYARGGASCLSVLTDGPFFQGSLDIFRAVRTASNLPMLRKDFMIDEWQFYEARAVGADAVLLITSILSDEELKRFHDLADSLGMTALVETHSAEDIRRAMAGARPRLLGINNRDLHDANFKTTLDHTEAMLPVLNECASNQQRPALVSESGIYTADDVERLAGLGVSTVLVGESLMRQPDTEAACRQLMSKADTID